jgi:hypothetical protein
MNKKNHPVQKGLTILFVWGFILCSAFPGSTAEKKHKNEPSLLQVDTLDFETIAFRLAPLPLFTLTNNTLHAPNQNFPSQQKNKELPSQILKEEPKKSKRTENSLFTASLLTLTALNIADYVSTVKALQLPGLKEGNPIMRPFTKNILLFSAVKIGLTTLDFCLLKNIYKKNKTLGWILSIAGNFAMSYIVSNNIRKIQAVTRK